MYTIAKAKEAIKNGIRGYLLKDDSGKYVMKEVNRLPFYMEGSPGIGKTEIVRQIAEELNLGYVSFSLVHHTRNSLLGLPVIKELEGGDKYTCYTMSEIIAKVKEQVEAGYQEGILLLDEFPCMSETILPTMLAFLQTKNIGTHRLPEGWVIVLCGNPPAYNKTARTFDAAIMDRIRKLEIVFEPKVFLEYGKSIGIHQAILDYLSVHEENTYRYKKEKDSQELVTCRGWENVSHMLKTYETLDQEVDQEAISQYLKSEEVSADFGVFYKHYRCGVTAKCAADILNSIRTMYYVEKYKDLDNYGKWNILEYLVEYMESTYEDLTHELKIMEMADGMISSLLRKAKEEYDEEDDWIFGIDQFSSTCMSSYELVRWVKRSGVFLEYYADSPATTEVMNRWMDYESEKNLKKDIEVIGENLYEIAANRMELWKKDEMRYLLEEPVKAASDMIASLLCFAGLISQEHSLMEMLFRRISDSELFLRVMNLYPNETYLNLCVRFYNLEQ